jgi:hypothetical protein
MNAIMKRLKSRTYWAAMFSGALTIIEANYQVIAQLVPPKYQPYTPLIFPIVMMVMREVTKTAIEDK